MEKNKLYPGIKQAIGLLVRLLLLQIILGVVVSLGASLLDISEDYMSNQLAIVTLVATIIILFVGYHQTGASFKEVFPLKKINPLLLIPVFITVTGAGILLSEVDNLFRMVLPMPWLIKEIFSKLAESWLFILFAMILGPFMEELLFRGLILHGFLSRYSALKTILLSALFFAIFHINPWQVPFAFFLGILFAWWFVKTGSLVPCIFGHIIANSKPFFILLVKLKIHIPGYTGTLETLELQPLWFDIFGLLLTALGIWIMIRMFPSAKPPGEKQYEV